MIAAAGLDMAAWDALAKAADLPLCVLLGIGWPGEVLQQQRTLVEPEVVAEEALELRDEGNCSGLKLRLGREKPDDLATIVAVRKALGDQMR